MLIYPTRPLNFLSNPPELPILKRKTKKIKKKKGQKRRKVPNVAALNGLFTDMRMSSSMYEVFNWNSSPDPPLTPGKHKRASLSLPPTTDIFAIDDKSDSDTRRPMIQRAACGES